MTVRSYIQLMRPANLLTAVADVLAGYAIAFHALPGFVPAVGWLVVSTVGLYGGGVVLNDVFDAPLDAVERPERPIPSGKVKIKEAMAFGFLLLALGAAAAWYYHPVSGIIASSIAVLAVFYNTVSKVHPFFGPLNMGLCRGANLLLGISANPDVLSAHGHIAVLPIIYIAAVTMVSRGEVKGGNTRTLYWAAILYGAVILTQLYIAWFSHNRFYDCLAMLTVFSLFVFKPLWEAFRDPVAPNIAKAVKAGVLALILMDAAWCLAYGNFTMGLITFALLPLSVFISKFFSVT